MVQKRPFGEEQNAYKVSSKHPRQLEDGGQMVSFLEFPSDDVDHNPHTSGEGDAGSREGYIQGNFTKLPIGDEKGIDNSVPGSVSDSSWGTRSTSQEDVRSEAPYHILFSPEYYYPNHQMRTLIFPEERYSSLVEFPARKLVSIGPEFQADIPEWDKQSARNSSSSDSAEPLSLSPCGFQSHLVEHIDDQNRFSGTCVVPMPELQSSACVNDEVGQGRYDCFCEDAGSVRCIRQHILEAREKFKKTLGKETFSELGFYDMGEVVAERWNEDDEQFFHEVVFSNPVSLGKNFWEHLAAAFPSRNKKEIVSYYFNVFMLTRRAEQNKCDPINVDSDNDEWQGSDVDDNEDRQVEDEDDSVVESPAYQDLPGQNLVLEDYTYEYDEVGLQEYDEGILHETKDDKEDFDLHGDKVVVTMLEKSPRRLQEKDNADSTVKRGDNIMLDGSRDHDNQDDSCTSSETVATPQLTGMQAEGRKHLNGTYSMDGGHEFGLEPCDTKVWDVGYLSCQKNDVDFFPTCSAIEEVFGIGDWNCKPRDGKGLS